MQDTLIERKEFNFERHTRLMFVGSRIFISPLEAMYGMLAYIFCKDLHASPLQLTLIVSLRPIMALFSFYGSSFIKDRPHNLKALILGANIISLVPCFFIPFINEIWFLLFSYALFTMSRRAIIPAWSEILRLNVSSQERGHIFSQGSSAHYLVNLLIPLVIAPVMDLYPSIWKWIFCLLAVFNILTLILTLCIQIKHVSEPLENSGFFFPKSSSLDLLLTPWKNSWSLMKERADFRKFQLIFMFGGGGLMVMQPSLPVFFNELHLSYTQLTVAMSICKGIAFALTSQIWANWMNRIPIHLFNAYVTAFATLFAGLILLASFHIYWIYVAYLIYGTMQAGSELSWNLSGPIFAKEKDSTLFTGINVAMVGLRGCVAPLLGGYILSKFGAPYAFLAGGCLCVGGCFYSLWLNWSSETKVSLNC